MPYEGVGARHDAVATKIVKHGNPCVENGFPGTAAKNAQLDRFVRPGSAEATDVAVGEPFVIQLGGVHEVSGAQIPGGVAAAPVGTPIFITTATNAIVLAAGVGIEKFGRVTEVIASRNIVRVNADARDTF